MYSVEEVCTTAMTMAGRGDKPSNEDLNNAVKMLGSILSDWALTRGVHLWNLVDQSINVPTADWVTNDGLTYKCYRDHVADADNEPGTGDLWEDFWLLAEDTDYSPTAGAWTLGFNYKTNHTYALNSLTDEDILSVRVQHAGGISYVDKVSALDFSKLDVTSFGLPEKVWVEKAVDGPVIHIWPMCDYEDATMIYYLVRKPGAPDKSATMAIPTQWIPALYYALAVELGFFYNIGLDRLNILGQKAQYEFAKAARTNESEVDECFVTPCY